MRALVTGANGFVGRHLIDHLLEAGDEVVGTYLAAGPAAPSNPRCEFVTLDVNDSDGMVSVLKRCRPEVVYHLAGMAFVPDAEASFDRVVDVNVCGTANIFRNCHLLDLGATVVCISSAEVYGKVLPTELPIKESSSLKPATNYGLSKLMAELVSERYDRQGTVRAVIARPFNHIGAGQDPRFVAPSFALQLANLSRSDGAKAIQVGNLDARRDFSDVRDIVRGYRLAALKGRGVFNFGSGRSYAIRELLDLLIAECGIPVEVHFDPTRMRAAEVPNLYGSFEKAKIELGWEPRYSIKESLAWVYKDALERVK